MKPRINIKASSPYRPLFERGGTRYKVILGGRGSGKSFTVSTSLIDRTYDDDGTILFTRYTLVNAEVSILPEFVDKIERLRLQGDFLKSGNDLINTRTGGRILFRGIKTSSGINTAALKSIPKLKMWVNDESEELVDETVFDTIDLSIRYNEMPGEVWLVANPPDIEHFIYRRFFKERGIEDVWNGVKDDVTYIHTTYLTNPHLPPEYVALAEKCREVDAEKYDNVWLGHFAMHKEGLIYKGWQKVTDADWPTHLRCWYGVDWGVQDPTAIVRCTYDSETGILWFKELMYRGEYNISVIAGVIRNDILNRKRTLTVGGKTLVWENRSLTCECEAITGDIGETGFRDSLARHGIEGWMAGEVTEWVEGILRYDGEIYCDPSRPENIKSLKIDNMLWAIEANNRDKVGRIQYLRYFDVCFIGDNIEHEKNGYRWKQSKLDKTRYIDEPQEEDDHCFTADTIIETATGPRQICEVGAGEYVITSEGPKQVLRLWNNGRKKICKYRINFVSLHIDIQATPNHKVKTQNGWKSIENLQAGEIVFLCRNLTERNTTSTKGRSTTQNTTSGCTASCGNTTTGRYLPGIISTIKTGIRRIMTSPILNLSKGANTKADTRGSRPQIPKSSQQSGSVCCTLENPQRNGIAARRDGRGIVNTQSRKSASRENISVRSAEVSTEAATLRQSTVRQNAMRKQDEIAGQITKYGGARSAEKNLKQINTRSNDFVVPLVVQSIESSEASEADVFDLTIADTHEYTANGLLVHNCMDACNYACTSHLRKIGIKNKLGEQ